MTRETKHPRNFVAKELWTPKFRHKVEQPKKENKDDWKKELDEDDFSPDGLVND